MCEIICVIGLCRLIASMAERKHKPAWPFVLFLIFAWITGEVGGFIFGLLVFGNENQEGIIAVIVTGYAFAFIGAGFAFLVLAMIPSSEPPTRRRRRDFLMDEDFQPRRRGREDDDYDDRGRFVDYHEDDRPPRDQPRYDIDPDDGRFRERRD